MIKVNYDSADSFLAELQLHALTLDCVRVQRTEGESCVAGFVTGAALCRVLHEYRYEGSESVADYLRTYARDLRLEVRGGIYSIEVTAP